MTHRQSSLTALACATAIALYAGVPTFATGQEAASSPLRLASTRVSIAGTSNVHAYTASTDAARLVRLQLAGSVVAGDVWSEIVKPGAIEAFEIAIPAATLSSPREGLDKNMHKALKVVEHPDITFRLTRLEGAAASGTMRGVGTLTIAGVARDVTLNLETQQNESTFRVKGEVQLLMTDFGITPPKAMLGMLKTDPKVTVTFETALAAAVAERTR